MKYLVIPIILCIFGACKSEEEHLIVLKTHCYKGDCNCHAYTISETKADRFYLVFSCDTSLNGFGDLLTYTNDTIIWKNNH